MVIGYDIYYEHKIVEEQSNYFQDFFYFHLKILDWFIVRGYV